MTKMDERRNGREAGGALRLVLGDQLSPGLSGLDEMDIATDTVLMAEVMDECTYVPHHQQKIVLVLAAMRHFAAGLAARGVAVRYVRLDDPANTGSIAGEVARAVAALTPAKLIATEAGEWRLAQIMAGWRDQLGVAVEIRADGRFLCSHSDFTAWAAGRANLRMEYFYREMRRRYRVLVDGDAPCGGQWNFDSENRKRLPRDVAVPAVKQFAPDAITAEVIALVAAQFGGHMGRATDFAWPVTAADAMQAFDDFVRHRLPGFGDWQDAMAAGQPFLFHSLISASLNLGLLDARALCAAVEAQYRAGRVALNAAEGFIRQILGWREFIRGVYWHHMPGYAQKNALGAARALPDFYWTARTDMRCLQQAITHTIDHAYAHHIHRLMITGNFALLTGIAPDAVDAWYLAVYADAYEWVEMPNTRGMALFADGGIVGSKPYAASGAYINKMSDYCSGCAYDVKQSTGPNACPFNFLYWHFIATHAEKFARNPRMAMPVASWARMAPGKRQALLADAESFLAGLNTTP